MELLIKIKGFYIFGIFILAAHLLPAQTKLSVNGAMLNMLPAVFVSTNDVLLSPGSSLTVTGSTLKVANSIVSSGAIDVSNGTVEMNGTQAQSIPANAFTGNVIKNLTINNSGSVVSIGGPLALTDVLMLSNGSLASGGNLTLKSTVTNTARVAPVTSTATTPVSGDVIVERFITSKRAFRFLTAPVNTTTTIRTNWMENTNNTSTSVNYNPVPDYGTHITGYAGDSGGFDVTLTNNPSLFTFDVPTQAWVAAPNTNANLVAGSGYRIMVRGSRSTNLNSNTPPSSITTLRAKGTLLTGTITMAKQGAGGTIGMPTLSSAISGYTFVGNPYASPIDWLLLQKTDLASTIYIFDPTISGSNGRGAYVSYNENTGVSNISSPIDNNIQLGQSFFVQTNGPNPTLTIKEVHKSTVRKSVFRKQNNLPCLSLLLLLPGQDTAGGSADGLATYFSNDFDSSVGDEDSYKITNLDENIAILRDGKNLSMEGRKPVATTDTIPLKIWQLSQKKYSFKVRVSHLTENVTTYLDDTYLNLKTELNNDTTTLVPFNITSDSASFAVDRFRIVFAKSSTPGTTMMGLKAYEKNKGVEVEWMSEAEANIERYDIEKSVDGKLFVKAGTVKAKINTGFSAYNWFDETPLTGDNYYRVKSVTKSGAVKCSDVVKINLKNPNEIVSVFASAGKGNTINLILKNITKGNYIISMVNSQGQKMFSGNVAHSGGSATQQIKLNNYLPAGIYHIHLSLGDRIFNIPFLAK